MSETIEAKELQLVSIFSDNYRFEIPDYQRPYAWTTEQTGALLDDLLHAMGHVENVSDAPPYFPGSIVTIKNDLVRFYQPIADRYANSEEVTREMLYEDDPLPDAYGEAIHKPEAISIDVVIEAQVTTCTGGPAVQYIARFRPDEDEPLRIAVQHQDWGENWQNLNLTQTELEAVQQFLDIFDLAEYAHA